MITTVLNVEFADVELQYLLEALDNESKEISSEISRRTNVLKDIEDSRFMTGFREENPDFLDYGFRDIQMLASKLEANRSVRKKIVGAHQKAWDRKKIGK